MGKADDSSAPRPGKARLALAGLAGLTLVSLPFWAGKTDPWRAWAAATLGLALGAVWALTGPRRAPRGAVLLAAALLLAAGTMWASVCLGAAARTMLLWVACATTLLAAYGLATAGLGSVVVGSLAAAMAGVALWSVREYFFTALAVGDASWRPFGPFVNPNALAGYALAGLPAIAALAAALRKLAADKEPGHPTRLAFLTIAALAAVSCLALVLTGSKGGLLAAGVAVVAVVGRARGGKWALGAAVALVVLGLLLPPVRNRLAAAFSTQRGTSLGFRAQTWAGTWDLARARPLTGWGPGCFAHAYPRFARVPYTAMAHCSWLQMGAEVGMPAAVLALGAFCLLFADCLRRPTVWGPAGAFAVAAFVIHNLVDYTLYLPAVPMSTLALAGVALGSRGEAEPVPEAAGRPGTGRWVVAGALLAGVALSLWFGAAAVQGFRAEGLVRAGFYHPAEARVRVAAERVRLDRDLWVMLAKIREGLAGSPPAPESLMSAAEAYERAIGAAWTDPAGYIGAARCYRQAGRATEAVLFAQRAVAVYPRGPSALLELARCLEQAGRTREALGVYRRLADLADQAYGQYPALEGWADYRIAVGAAAAARTETGEQASRLWRTAGRILADSLTWDRVYHGSLEAGGRADPGLQAELDSLALDVAAALERSDGAGDAELAGKLRGLVEE